MSLNCLSSHELRRSDSEREYLQGKSHRNKVCCIKVERSWSGNLSPPSYGEIGRNCTAVAERKVIKKEPRRLNSTGGVAFKGCEEPKLVRSSGMRRDWSFEDLRKACNIISFMVYLAPVATFIRIFRKKSKEDFQSVPYFVALFSSMLWLCYAMLKKDAILLVTINSFGSVIETIYIVIYIAYATRESKVSTIKLLVSMNMGLFSLILLLTLFLVSGSVRVKTLGWLCVAFSVCVFAAPLNILKQVIRTKSVEFTLSFFLTPSAVMWFAYGLLSRTCVLLFGTYVLGLLQRLLYGIYRNTEKVTEEKKLKGENLKSIVTLSALGASEVYPVDAQPDEGAEGHDQSEESNLGEREKHGSFT